MIRDKLYLMVEPSASDREATLYDVVMILAIIASTIPLMFKEQPYFFDVIDRVVTVLFIADYLIRWITADKKLKRSGTVAFVMYPLTLMAIIDLFSILPGLIVINPSFRLLRITRLLRMFRVFRIFKSMRYSRNIQLITNVLKAQKGSLIAICYFAVGYIFISALVMFNVEPNTFTNFFDAIYWAAVSLTTVGYGDLYPVSTIGRVVAIFSSFFGIAIVALPAGILTAGFMDEFTKSRE